METTLIEAAEDAYNKLAIKWINGRLQTALRNFVNDCLDLFPDDSPGGRPCANWLVLIDALQNDMDPAAFTDINAMQTSALYVYKMCWMTWQLEDQGSITTAQADAVLASYNARIATDP